MVQLIGYFAIFYFLFFSESGKTLLLFLSGLLAGFASG